jgi:hypothetical protein
MTLENGIGLIKYVVVGAGLAASLTMCSSPKRVYDCYSGRSAAALVWQDMPEQTKYDLVERTLLQMPEKELYSMGARVFYTRIKNGVENRADDVITLIKKQHGDAK